jgi:hypothetical protein
MNMMQLELQSKNSIKKITNPNKAINLVNKQA